jgi:DNA-binding MarR family transcriptional regulator
MKESSIPIGKLLTELAKNYFGVLSEKLEKKTGINRYYYALLVIKQGEGVLTQQMLTDLLSTDKVTMVRVVDYLSKKGLVKRQSNDKDRRAYQLVLTTKGEKIIPEIKQAYIEMEEILFDGITEKKKKEFNDCIAMMQANLNQLPSKKLNLKIVHSTKNSN